MLFPQKSCEPEARISKTNGVIFIYWAALLMENIALYKEFFSLANQSTECIITRDPILWHHIFFRRSAASSSRRICRGNGFQLLSTAHVIRPSFYWWLTRLFNPVLSYFVLLRNLRSRVDNKYIILLTAAFLAISCASGISLYLGQIRWDSGLSVSVDRWWWCPSWSFTDGLPHSPISHLQSLTFNLSPSISRLQSLTLIFHHLLISHYYIFFSSTDISKLVSSLSKLPFWSLRWL